MLLHAAAAEGSMICDVCCRCFLLLSDFDDQKNEIGVCRGVLHSCRWLPHDCQRAVHDSRRRLLLLGRRCPSDQHRRARQCVSAHRSEPQCTLHRDWKLHPVGRHSHSIHREVELRVFVPTFLHHLFPQRRHCRFWPCLVRGHRFPLCNHCRSQRVVLRLFSRREWSY